mmetsp:Transcript_14152/g.49244  ORF Transcript_14152/g.49244 Transcript_14152/m.49244 type:complete len:287 (+) Transcript_14152:1931-2791(+)
MRRTCLVALFERVQQLLRGAHDVCLEADCLHLAVSILPDLHLVPPVQEIQAAAAIDLEEGHGAFEPHAHNLTRFHGTENVASRHGFDARHCERLSAARLSIGEARGVATLEHERHLRLNGVCVHVGVIVVLSERVVERENLVVQVLGDAVNLVLARVHVNLWVEAAHAVPVLARDLLGVHGPLPHANGDLALPGLCMPAIVVRVLRPEALNHSLEVNVPWPAHLLVVALLCAALRLVGIGAPPPVLPLALEFGNRRHRRVAGATATDRLADASFLRCLRLHRAAAL